jgi:hypothetical protein
VRQLVVISVSPDGTRVLLGRDTDARPTHELLIDARLDRAVRGQPLDDGDAAASALSPKEIQSRLRSGASVDEVAREAGVPRSRVERYAGPVLSERENMLEMIRAATLTRARVGRSVRPLGAAVAANLETTAFAHTDTAQWSAYRRADGAWVARLDIVVRGRSRRAEWAHDAVRGEVTALDAYAATLGFVGAPVARPESPPAKKAGAQKIAAPTMVGPKSAAKKSSGTRAATKASARKAAKKTQ